MSFEMSSSYIVPLKTIATGKVLTQSLYVTIDFSETANKYRTLTFIFNLLKASFPFALPGEDFEQTFFGEIGEK